MIMQTPIDWAVLFAFIAVAVAAGTNSYHFLKESRYIKKKYKDKGYQQGWEAAKKHYTKRK